MQRLKTARPLRTALTQQGPGPPAGDSPRALLSASESERPLTARGRTACGAQLPAGSQVPRPCSADAGARAGSSPPRPRHSWGPARTLGYGEPDPAHSELRAVPSLELSLPATGRSALHSASEVLSRSRGLRAAPPTIAHHQGEARPQRPRPGQLQAVGFSPRQGWEQE